VSPQEYIDQVVQAGNVPAVVADVARGKALALVVEKAVVSDESGNPVDLTRLQEDGTLLDESEVVDDVEEVAEAAVAPSTGDVTFAQVSDVEQPVEADAEDAPTANKSDAAE
jgi:trigger factor